MLLTSIKISRSLVYFGGNPFADCSSLEESDDLENLNFALADGVFMDNEMTGMIHCLPSKSGDYSILDTVTTIYQYTFSEYENIASISISRSVTNIWKK